MQSIEKDCKCTKNAKKTCKNLQNRLYYKSKIKKNEISKKNYTLLPSKYIEFVDHDLDIDYENEMKRIQGEMKIVVSEEQDSQKMLIEAFGGIGYGIKEV